MIKITKTIENRYITEEEFRLQKSSSEFASMRQAAKSCNFLLIFGGSPKVFAENALEISWSLDQVEDYIKENHCEPELEMVKKSYRRESETKQKYIAVATRIRSNFFKGYPGLLERISVEQDFAANHGYLRSPFGATRNLIELMLKGTYDEETISGILRNLNNITANYYCQQVEGAYTKRNMYDLQMWLEENNMKSKVWNEIHDSIDIYVHKDEAQVVLNKAKELLERKVPELAEGWVPLTVDCEIADLSDENHHDCYKGGRDPKEFGLEW